MWSDFWVCLSLPALIISRTSGNNAKNYNHAFKIVYYVYAFEQCSKIKPISYAQHYTQQVKLYAH